MRYRLMATYRGVPYEVGLGPSNSEVVLFAACPPPEELGFEPATGHWRKPVIRAQIDALWESRPVGMFRGEPCIVLDDPGERLHIAYLGADAERATRLGYWQVDRGVFELLAPRDEVTELTEERVEKPLRWGELAEATGPMATYPYGTAPWPVAAPLAPASPPPADGVSAEETVPGAGGPLDDVLTAEAKPPAAEAPVAEDPEAEIPLAEIPLAEGPVAEALVAEDPLAKDPEAEDPLAKDPLAEIPLAEILLAEDPVAEIPVADIQVAEDSVADIQVAEVPLAGTPAAEVPIPEDPAEVPAARRRLVKTRVSDTPLADALMAESPAAEVPAAGIPMPDSPVTSMPPAKTPVSDTPLADALMAETQLARRTATPLASAPLAAPLADDPMTGRPARAPLADDPTAGRPARAPLASAPLAAPLADDPMAGRPAGTPLASVPPASVSPETVAPAPVPVPSAVSAAADDGTQAATGSWPAYPSTGTDPYSDPVSAGDALPYPDEDDPLDLPVPPGFYDPPEDALAGLTPVGDTGGRAARRQRVPTREIFCELADLASIPRAAYALETETDGAICLLPTPDGFDVFIAADGARHELRSFAEEEAAYFYLFGVLAADAVRSGTLAPTVTMANPYGGTE
jgi:hypothetical protein